MWRWDQGRLLYFQFDVLRKIAQVLVQFDNVDVAQCENLFRTALVNGTGMPFLPTDYTIKRNYSRVFQCSFLANFIGTKLVVTDVCKDLASANGKQKTVDDYLLNYIPRFCFPFPAFDNYNCTEPRVYPFCAIIKFLLAQASRGLEAKLSLDDVFFSIIANHCTGFEDINYYSSLTPKPYHYTDTERRQLREMIIFVSQLSILKVYNGYLYLDTIEENAIQELLTTFLQPDIHSPKADKIEEFYSISSMSSTFATPTFDAVSFNPVDVEFIEGDKKRIEHFRIERSVLLRKYYRQMNPKPRCCACGTDMNVRYPWTDYLLEIHHLLPLSSAVAISNKGTSLTDIVGLCPSCHRAIHMYYKKWLTANEQSDFKSKAEAHAVFLQATREIA